MLPPLSRTFKAPFSTAQTKPAENPQSGTRSEPNRHAFNLRRLRRKILLRQYLPVWVALMIGCFAMLGFESVAKSAAPTYTGCTAEIVEATQVDFEHEVARLINTERATNDLPPLKMVNELSDAARYHVADMFQDSYFDHDSYDRLDGELQFACSWYKRISNFYKGLTIGENLSRGYPNPAAAVAGWMASPTHRENILSEYYREFGVGYQNRFWGLEFGSRYGVYPLVINGDAPKTTDTSVNIYIHGDQWQEMRLRNDDDEWGNWQTFSNKAQWTLKNEVGVRTVSVEMRNSTTTATSADSIEFVSISGDPVSTATQTPPLTETPVPSQTPTATPTPATSQDEQPILIGKIKLNVGLVASGTGRSLAPQVDFISVTTSQLVTTVNATTDTNGQFTIRPVPLGEYDVSVKGEGSLRSMLRVTIGNGTTEVEFGELLTGDIVPDNQINLLDFSTIATAYGTCLGAPAYPPQADLDGDGCIDADDLGSLQENFGKQGSPLPDEAADNSTTNQEIAKIEIQTVGNWISVDINISGSNTNLINSGALFLNFDPAKLKVVSITPAAPFTLVFTSEINNELGQINWVAGQLGEGSAPSFTFATILFEVIDSFESSPLTISFTDSRHSDFASHGQSLLNNDNSSDSLSITGLPTNSPDHPNTNNPGARVFLPLVQR